MKAVREASKRSLLASVLRRCDHAGKPLLWGPVVGLAGVLLFAAAAAIVWGADPALQPVPPGPIIGVSPWQGLGPAAPYPICGVDCTNGCADCFGRPRECRWEDARLIAWQAYAQGEYVGHARTEHVPEYRLRVDDQLDMLYRVTRDEIRTQYKLNVGDEVRIESFTDPELNRSLMLQPDGMITLRLLGQVHAAGSTVTQLRDTLEELYKKYYKVPSITVTPTKVNTQLDDLRSVVDRHYGVGGQGAVVRVAPDGTISLTAIGHVRAGVDARRTAAGNQRTLPREDRGHGDHPRADRQGPAYVHVLGEVRARAVSRCWGRRPPCRHWRWRAVGTWARTSRR